MNIKELIDYNFTMPQELSEKIGVIEHRANKGDLTNRELLVLSNVKKIQKIIADVLPADVTHWDESHGNMLIARTELIKETLLFIDHMGLMGPASTPKAKPPTATLVRMLQFREARSQDTRADDPVLITEYKRSVRLYDLAITYGSLTVGADMGAMLDIAHNPKTEYSTAIEIYDVALRAIGVDPTTNPERYLANKLLAVDTRLIPELETHYKEAETSLFGTPVPYAEGRLNLLHNLATSSLAPLTANREVNYIQTLQTAVKHLAETYLELNPEIKESEQ